MGMKNSRWLSLLVLCTGFLLIVVDMTIVNVALPSIQRDLGFTQSGLAWVINAYLIAFGGLLLLAGRLIAQSVSWHWIFFVNLPLGIVTALLAARLLEPDRGIGIRQGADILGAVMVTAALMLGVYTIVQTSDYGLVSARTAVLGAVTMVLLAAFVVRQARGRNPILPLRLFRSRKVTGSNVVQALMSTSFLGFFFVCSLDFQRVQGYGPMAIGLAFLPVAVVMALFSIRFSALLIGRFGAGRILVAGQAVALVALTMVAVGPTHANYLVHMLVPLALLGLGGGLTFPALTMIAMEDVSPMDAGLASGLLNTTGQVGGAFGLAVLATLAGAYSVDMLRGGADTVQALAGGYHFAWFVSAGVVVATLGVAAWLLRSNRAEQMDTAAAECEAAA